MRLSLSTQGWRTASVFQHSTRRPPGRITRSASRLAACTSTQCQVCAHVSASTESSASPVASAVARHTGTAGSTVWKTRVMSPLGSQASTERESSQSNCVNLPVPAPTSQTVPGPTSSLSAAG